MNASLLSSEATHSSLDLFKNPHYWWFLMVAFCQKLGTNSSPNGATLEFEAAGDRNNFIDLQKNFFEVKCKIVQSSKADLKYDALAIADITKTDFPYFCSNVLHSLFFDCTLSANGLKSLVANGYYAEKNSFGSSSHIFKMQKTHGWIVRDTLMRKTRELFQLQKWTEQNFWWGNKLSAHSMVELLYTFSTCDRHLLTGVTVRNAFRLSFYDCVIMCDDAAKQHKVKIVEADLFVRNMTLNDTIVSALEKTFLSSPASYPYLETLTKTFFNSTGLHSWRQEDIFAREPNRRPAICFNTNEAFLGNNRQNQFHFQKYNLG